MKNERDMENKIKFQYMWEKFLKNEGAVSQVIGTTLMVGMTVILIAVAGVAVLGFTLPASAPQAKIVIVEAKGDISYSTALYKNFIALRHKGGEALIKNDTKIIITGKGYAYTDTMPSGPAPDMRVTYRDLTGKNYYYTGQKQIVEGISWDPGETVTLYGYDGVNINSEITENQGNTVDSRWKLQAGSTVLVTVIDIPTNSVIAVFQATVNKA